MNKHDIEKIVVAAEILDNSLQTPPTIAELAKQLAINQQKLKRNFKLVHQITIRQYVLQKRLQVAKDLLLNNEDLSISAISDEIGYNNASYFARRFREKYGMLPNELRNNHK